MMRTTVARAATVSALAALGLMTATGCSTTGGSVGSPGSVRASSVPTFSAGAPSAGTPSAVGTPPPTGTPLYLVDGNTGNSLGASLPMGLLAGVKGTIPGAKTTQEFTDALLAVDPELTSFSYAPEAYDAVILAALAAAAGQSDAGVDMAKQLAPITNGPEACTDYAGCLELLRLGKQIDYNGRSGALDLSPGGDPTSASIGVYTFGSDNVLRPDVTYQQGGIVPDPTAPVPGDTPVQKGAGDGVLTIATFLPATGSLALLGPPETAGVRLAIQDIEAAGGIPGIDSIVLVKGDSGEVSTTTGQQTLKRLLPEKPDVIIGAASSASTLAALDQITRAGVLMISPASSAPALSTVADDGLFWRTAPSDALQGAVVAAEVLADGHTRVAVLSRQDVYGEGLNASVTQAITDGGGEVVANVDYDPASTDFAADVAKVRAADPDAIVLIGFEESAQIIRELARQGIGPNALG